MVYRAQDEAGRNYAVKVMNGSSPDAVREIEREVKLLRALGWGTFLADEKEAFDTRAWVVREGEIRTIESAGPEQGEISPAVVRAIAACDFNDAGIVRAARPVLRSIISYYVGDTGLQTRSTMARWAML